MDSAAEHEIAGELGTGERLLWVGRPSVRITLYWSDVFAMLFGAAWTGASILSLRPADKPPPLLFVLAMAAFGLYLTFGRFLVGAYLRRKIYYGVTNERIVIKSEILRSRVRSLNLRTLVEVTLTERRDGKGTISFGRSSLGLACARR